MPPRCRSRSRSPAPGGPRKQRRARTGRRQLVPKPLTQTTGRRKQAIARVRLRPIAEAGEGKVVINRRPIDDYFPSATHRMIVTEPLRLTSLVESYDVDATIAGGGVAGQAGA